jgi:hypothetical protein
MCLVGKGDEPARKPTVKHHDDPQLRALAQKVCDAWNEMEYRPSGYAGYDIPQTGPLMMAIEELDEYLHPEEYES